MSDRFVCEPLTQQQLDLAHHALHCGTQPKVGVRRALEHIYGPAVTHGLHPYRRGSGGANRHFDATTEVPLRDKPEAVFDAPGMEDDFYSSPLAWSKRGGLLALATPDGVSFADPMHRAAAPRTYRTRNDTPSAIGWLGGRGTEYAVVGFQSGRVLEFDHSRMAHGDSGVHLSDYAVTALACSDELGAIAVGGADGTVAVLDSRAAKRVAWWTGHSSKVCGLAWSPDGNMLATGGNDDCLNLWDRRKATRWVGLGEHTAAVKALAWCPWDPNLLASGGGSRDRRLRFWDASTGKQVGDPLDTQRQVTSIIWSPRSCGEILTTHGFADGSSSSRSSALTLWQYPKLGELRGWGRISSRVEDPACWCDLSSPPRVRIQQAVASPDGTRAAMVSAASERVYIWNLWTPAIGIESRRTEMDAVADRMCSLYALR